MIKFSNGQIKSTVTSKISNRDALVRLMLQRQIGELCIRKKAI